MAATEFPRDWFAVKWSLTKRKQTDKVLGKGVYTLKLSDFVLRFLEQKKIQTMFFVPGGGCMHLADSLARSTIEGVNLLHEQAAAIAAESYAFTAGSVGALLVTTGPGGTNAITGVLSAYLDSIPCIVLSGQVKTSDLKRRFGVRSHGSQEADIISMVKGITKYAVMVEEKDAIRYHLEKAWHEATTGRKGPVWIDIPLDIQGSTIDEDSLAGFTAPAPDEPQLREVSNRIIEMLKASQRPVLIAGNGLRGAQAQFEEWIQRWSLPIIPTWKAADLVANDHPLYVGRCGTMGERAANFAMQTADLLICLGSRLDFSITGFDRSKWAPNAKKIVVDVDEREIYKLQTPIELPVICEVKPLLEQLNQCEAGSGGYAKWWDKIRQWKERYPIFCKGNDTTGFISTYQLVDEICRQMPSDAVLVPASAGTVAEICYQSLNIRTGQAVRSNHGLGAMGYEVPAAIGAAIASGKTVVTLAGDGGMQLNIQELAILAGRGLPVKIFVVNNEGYSSIRNMQRNHFQGRYIGSNEDTGLFLPDMAALAGAYGISANCIQDQAELAAGVAQAFACTGPFLCNVKIDPFCIVSPRSTSKVLPDGRIISAPLEDLFPFLPEQQLRQEMRTD